MQVGIRHVGDTTKAGGTVDIPPGFFTQLRDGQYVMVMSGSLGFQLPSMVCTRLTGCCCDSILALCAVYHVE